MPDAPLDLDALRALLTLVETGSVQGAARSLGASRATVRRRLEQLEAAVGRSLVERGDGGVFLTAAGRALVEDGASLLAAAQGAVSRARAAAPDAALPLRLLAPVGLPPEFAALLVAQARAAGHGYHLDLHLSADPLSQAGEGWDLLVYIGTAPASGPFVTRRIVTIPEQLVATRGYLDARGVPTSASDLVDHDLLTWVPPGEDPGRWPLRDGGAVEVQPWLRSPDIHFVRQLMLSGQGIARVPDAGLPDRGWDEGVVSVLPDEVGCERDVRLLVPEGLHRTPRMRVAFEVFQSVAALG